MSLVDHLTVGVIVVASGRSERMGGVDKLWADVQGLPVLSHSVATLAHIPNLTDLVVVLRPQMIEHAQTLRDHAPWTSVTHLVAGGEHRQDSVYHGLNALRPCDIVLIHDGARPLVPLSIARAGIDTAARSGAATAALPVADTIKQVTDGVVVATLDRRNLWAVQTPQVFRYALLVRAYAECGDARTTVTDDCALVERLGVAVHTFVGSPLCHKVSTPFDLTLVRLLAQIADSAEPTVG